MRAALRYDRYNRSIQSDAVVTMTRLAQQLRAAKQLSAAQQAAEQAVRFYQAYEAQTRPFKVNGREFLHHKGGQGSRGRESDDGTRT